MSNSGGENMTLAVIQSLREWLERVQRSRGTASADELLAIKLRCAQGLRGAAVPHGEFLYDEQGLPQGSSTVRPSSRSCLASPTLRFTPTPSPRPVQRPKACAFPRSRETLPQPCMTPAMHQFVASRRDLGVTGTPAMLY